ncbi:MAG: hypothetical protein R3B70_04045 [Polyangiaceae bacterium]
MSFQRLLPTLLLGALAFGCVNAAPTAEGGALDEAAQAFEEDPGVLIVSTNGLLPGLLTDADNQAQLAQLAQTDIGGETTLTDTNEGRNLLVHAAMCALAEGDVAYTTDSYGNTYRLTGRIGLAPAWKDQAITPTEGRWISACLLAHANAYGVAVDIALRGEHPALQDAPPEGFSAQEAAFYGDLFQGGDAFACIGESPSHPDGAPTRVCGRSSECRFVITGTCAPTSQDAVCESGTDAYRSCATRDPGDNRNEVITVYTMPGTFGMPPQCDHSPYETGLPLPETCSQTVANVCHLDAYCCDVDWDSKCVDLAEDLIQAL